MTTPFTDPRQTNNREQALSQGSGQSPSAVPWATPHLSQIVGYEQLSDFTHTHPTIRTDIHDSSSYNFPNSLDGVFPQDPFVALSHSSTSHAHFDPLGDSVAEEWDIQHRQQAPETHSQSFDPRTQQHQGTMQPSDFQPHPNLESASGPFIHLSGITSHPMDYSSSHHPLSPMPSITPAPAPAPAPVASISMPTRMESNTEIFHGNIESAATSLQVQQYGTSHMHDVQPAPRFFGYSAQSPRSSISQDDAYSLALAMNQLPLTDSQQASDTSSAIPRGSNERQVGSLTVATSNLALSTPCTSPSVSTSPYSATQQQQLDIPTGTDGTMDSLGTSSGGQCITAKGKRRTRRSKGDPSSLSMDDPSLPDGSGTGFHKKIANKRSRDRLSQTHSTSPIPLISHQSSTLASYAFSPATSSDPHPQTPSASSSPLVTASSSSISMGLPPHPPGVHHNVFAHHAASIDLSTVQTSGIMPGCHQYAHLTPSQPQQPRTATMQYHPQQPSPSQLSYSFSTNLSSPPNAFADNYRNVRPAIGIGPAPGLIRTLESSQSLPRQMLDRRRSSQGYSSDSLSTPGEGYLPRGDYFGYPSLPPQPPQPLQPSQPSQSSVLYHPYQQDQSSQHLHSNQKPSRSLGIPQQHQHQHQEQFQDQLFHQRHQQQQSHRHQEQFHFLQQQQQQHQQQQQQQQKQQQQQQQQFQLRQQQQQQLQLQQQQQQQYQQQRQQLSQPPYESIFARGDPQELGTQSDDEYTGHFTPPTNIPVPLGRAEVPRTRARSRTLPTLGDLGDILVEPLAQPQPLLTASSQQTGGWSRSTQAPTNASSTAIGIHPRAIPGASLLVELLPPSRIEELDSASPSPFHDKDMEVTSASEDAADLEGEVEETALRSILMESSSSPSTVVVSARQPKHPCPRCSKMFTRPFNLRSHILAHDNERPYACDGKITTGAKCKSRFARRHDLVRHIKAKHPDYSKDKDQRQESRSSNVHETE